MSLEKGVYLGLTQKKQSHKRRGKNFWIKAVNDFEGSSLSMQDFCAERGLAISTFHGWRRRLSATKPRSQKSSKSVSKPHFLPVYVTSPETPLENSKQPKRLLDPQTLSENSLAHLTELSSGLSIHLNEGLSISIDKEFHEPTLQRLVQLFSPKGLEVC